MDFLSADFWSDRYSQSHTGWDLAEISPPLKAYFDQLSDQSLRILIPGCGFGYEGIYLWKKGYYHVSMLDFASEPIQKIQDQCPEFPVSQLFVEDFFQHTGVYDLIIEQTLFCAIDPSLRKSYAEKISELLVPGGKLVGLLFDRQFEGGPPFGGTKDEYISYFQEHFSDVQLDPCYNSVAPRAGTELFIRIIKK